MSSTNFFVMVGKKDSPIFQLDLVGTERRGGADSKQKDDHRHLNQFIVHAALDVVEEAMWTTQSMYLKIVDKFNEYYLSAFVTAGHIKFLLLHDTRNDDGIRNFFQEVHELYMRTLLNPFYEPNTPITSTVFQNKVKVLSKRYL